MSLFVCVLACFTAMVLSSSHSEAPGTARGPHTDLTDFYTFVTRRGNVAFVANIAGLIQSQAGPNYNPVNNDFVYQIHVDNDGDAREDLTFQFLTGYRYINNGRGFEVQVQGHAVPIPLAHFSAVTADSVTHQTTGLNAEEYYRIRVLRGDDYSTPIEEGPFASINVNGETSYEFNKAFDNAGTRTFPGGATGYDAYNAYVENAAIYQNVHLPGCAEPISVFVGPRRESFGIALGEIFDLLNVSPGGAPVSDLGARNGPQFEFNGAAGDGDSIDRFGVISFVLEVPQQCVVGAAGSGRILGTWASVRKLEHHDSKHYAGEQTTRLANPLVNELLIGTTYKNEWNSRHPSGDERFNEFLLFPAVPAIAELLFGSNGIVAKAGADAPAFPRTDLLAVLHTGIPGINQPANTARHEDDSSSSSSSSSSDDDDHHHHHQHNQVKKQRAVFADLLRINLDTATFVECASQNSLGVIGGDNAGYPNGRRLGDDVVDITLKVAEGILCNSGAATAALCNGGVTPASTAALHFSDNSPTDACMFQCGTNDFPFLNPPLPGDQIFKISTGAPYQKSQWQDRTNPTLGHCQAASVQRPPFK